jgi:hypothetical protein
LPGAPQVDSRSFVYDYFSEVDDDFFAGKAHDSFHEPHLGSARVREDND